MTRTYDSIVIGGSADGLVAATALAQSGSTVLLVEARAELGGTFREIEFAPGYRAAPLATDLGHVDAGILQATGAMLPGAITPDPVAIALGDGEPLQLRRSIAATADGLKRHSAKDAAAWPAFGARMHALSGFLAELYRRAPPQLEASGLADYLALAKLGLKFRGLGRAGMIDLLRALPMPIADLLDDWFESDRLKGALAALAVADSCQGPASGGTALNFLHRHVGAEAGVFGDRLRLQTGGGAMIAAFADRARAASVTIETGAEVRRLLVADDRVVGVQLVSGEEIRSRVVVSSADPCRSLLELLDPVHLDPEFIAAVRNIRHRGVTSIVLLALDALPEIPGLATVPAGSILIAPSVRHVERAFDASKYGQCSEEPLVELRAVSIFDVNGNFVARAATGGNLNSPWGVAIAPASFGIFSNDLLIGNFGDGLINVYDPKTFAYLGQLMDTTGKSLAYLSLWELLPGGTAVMGTTAVSGGNTSTVYFTAGLAGEVHGLLGAITTNTTVGTPTFNLTAATPAVSVAAGSAATFDIKIVPVNGFSGTVALNCATIPLSGSCSFAPASVSVAANAVATATVTVQTFKANVSQRIISNTGIVSAVLLPFASILAFRRRKIATATMRFVRLLGLLLVFASVGGLITGCNGAGPNSSPSTPAGVTPIVVNAVSSAATQQTTVNLTVK